MNDPMKIIHKYKNNNRHVQYHIHIFVGDIIGKKYKDVLNKIQNMDLYRALTELTVRDTDLMTGKYGDYWYEKFFNSYHIDFTKEITLKNTVKMNELKKIYGAEWVKTHFDNYKKRIEPVSYSYETRIRTLMERKNMERTLKKKIKEDDDIIIDYSTTKKRETVNLDRIKSSEFDIIGEKVPSKSTANEDDEYSIGCDDPSTSGSESASDEIDSDVDSDYEIVSEDEEIEMVGGEGSDEMDTDADAIPPAIEEEILGEVPPELAEEAAEDITEESSNIDNDDIESLFSGLDDVDENVNITTRDIKTVLSEANYNKIYNQISTFDTGKDMNMFNEDLKNVYHKNYIYHQYIYKDDTVKTIHGKICCGFKNNEKYGENAFIVPSYQYLWAEYPFENEIKKIMIGQKWIIKNNVMPMDIEPNTNIGVYEDLRGNLKNLRDSIKRHGKIKREDDEQSVFYDYEGYYTSNEIFMTDIYNDLGIGYSAPYAEIRNLFDVYIKLYYNRIHNDDFTNILNLLKGTAVEIEHNKVKKIHDTINNDLILENEIMKDVELVRDGDRRKYRKYFKENIIMHSVVSAYVVNNYTKLSLFHIFDNYEMSEEYPFIQYHQINNAPYVRYNKNHILKNEKKDVVMKWFENSPYGISFKVRVNSSKNGNEYANIVLNDTGRINYNIQWKEEYMRTMDDVRISYNNVRKLIKKINKENPRLNLIIPDDDSFKPVFISSIQRFELPEKFVVDHDDLSTFARNFFPYVTMIIEPKKRRGKISDKDYVEISKYGTYLRYKRISKYENKSRIEHRIVFFMRNYEFNDQQLAVELSKEFNITEANALQEIANAYTKHAHIKKSRKVLKKFENLPKYKSPGITVDIQGKTRDKYKLKIAGARDEDQLNRIIDFMNVLIYLYIDTYLYKNPERQKMQDRLAKLTNIAKRRNKVEKVFKEETPSTNIKQMTKVDSKRLKTMGDEPRKWSKECQHSGLDTRRRPWQVLDPEELVLQGYTLQDTLNGTPFEHYARTLRVDDNGKVLPSGSKKGKEVTLRAIKLELDENNYIYYACNPEDNGKHMYIGFLGKDNSAPCCFIKDQFVSNNPKKRDIFMRGIGLTTETSALPISANDQMYILQDNIVVSDGRFAFLPKYLDILMNSMLHKRIEIDNHNLVDAADGYYFKYGVKTADSKYLSAISSVFDLSIEQIKKKMVAALENDKGNLIFTSLNNGDIRTQFKTTNTYIEYIKNNRFIDYNLVNDLICTPGVIRKFGTGVIFFQRKKRVYQKKFEKEKVKIDYYITCHNQENVVDLKDPNRETIILVKENKNYYPIVMVTKQDKYNSEFTIDKTYKYKNEESNVVNHVYDYYNLNCYSDYSVLVNDRTHENSTAKYTHRVLNEQSDKNYKVKAQYVDNRYKCKYILTNSGIIIPTIISGSIYDVKIVSSIEKYVKDHATTIKNLTAVAKATNGALKTTPIGFYYADKKNKSYSVTSIITENYNVVPVIKANVTADFIRTHKYIIRHKSDDDLIDKEILKGPSNVQVDDRIIDINKSKYKIELYQLFRLHLSYFLNNTEAGEKQRKKILEIINGKNIKKEKKVKLKKILYGISDTDLANRFDKLIQRNTADQRGGAVVQDKKWINVSANKKIDYPSIIFSNNRELCYNIDDKNACNTFTHCKWTSKNTCVLDVDKNMLPDFINKICEEFVQNDLKANEVLNIGDHTVMDVVSYNVFKERPDEEIIIGSSKNADKILGEIFGKENVPQIGKKRNKINLTQDYDMLNKNNPLNDINDWHVQNIIPNNNTVYRAFANAFFWSIHPYDNKNYRNLGYYSSLQSELSSIYKSQVVDWLQNDNNAKIVPVMNTEMETMKMADFVTKISMTSNDVSDNLIEMFVLSKLYNMIISVHDENYNFMFAFHPVDGWIKRIGEVNAKIKEKVYGDLNFRFSYSTKNNVPEKIDVLYHVEKKKQS